MKLQIDRIDQHAFINFVNKLKLIDSFIYFKIKDNNVISTVYLPQRDAVKHHSVPFGSIFQTQEVPSLDKELKIAFFDAGRIVDAFKQFEADAIRCEIEFPGEKKEEGAVSQQQSGNYLILHLCHSFNSQRSFTSMTVVRDTYGLHTNKG